MFTMMPGIFSKLSKSGHGFKAAAFFIKKQDHATCRMLYTSRERQTAVVEQTNHVQQEKSMVDFSKALQDFKRNGMAILPVKIDAEFIKKSNDMCFSAWTDALKRAKIIRGHDMKAGKDYGFKEIVMRAEGRYDILWKINGENHFLHKENVMEKFLPFVHNILGKTH